MEFKVGDVDGTLCFTRRPAREREREAPREHITTSTKKINRLETIETCPCPTLPNTQNVQREWNSLLITFSSSPRASSTEKHVRQKGVFFSYYIRFFSTQQSSIFSVPSVCVRRREEFSYNPGVLLLISRIARRWHGKNASSIVAGDPAAASLFGGENI